MASALQAAASYMADWWKRGRGHVEGRQSRADDTDMIGEYIADYSGLTAEELATSDPEADDLIARSRVVSSKRLC